jgi:hypothetical protein
VLNDDRNRRPNAGPPTTTPRHDDRDRRGRFRRFRRPCPFCHACPRRRTADPPVPFYACRFAVPAGSTAPANSGRPPVSAAPPVPPISQLGRVADSAVPAGAAARPVPRRHRRHRFSWFRRFRRFRARWSTRRRSPATVVSAHNRSTWARPYVMTRSSAHDPRIVCAQPGHDDGRSPHKRCVCSRRRSQTTGLGQMPPVLMPAVLDAAGAKPPNMGLNAHCAVTTTCLQLIAVPAPTHMRKREPDGESCLAVAAPGAVCCFDHRRNQVRDLLAGG